MRNGIDSGSAEGWKLVARGRSTYLCREATRFCHHTLGDIISRFFSPAADPGETSRRTKYLTERRYPGLPTEIHGLIG